MIPIARPFIGPEEEEAVARVVRSGRLAQGPEVAAFEEEFASLCGAPYAVACVNGTAALHLALLAHDIGPGDEVIVPAFTFAASGNAVLACGATPIFCDVREDDFNIDVADAETKVNASTKAIMPVHLYGQVADMDAVTELADRYRLAIIEDACQAHGATYNGRRAGSFSTAAFSLYATKNVMSGEGGMVTAQDDNTAERLRLLRNHGMPERYVHTTFGMNLRMTDLIAALGRVQLGRLEEGNKKRHDNAAYYTQQLHGAITLPRELPGREHVWHQYTVRVNNRDAVRQTMVENGVGAEVYYPTPVHRQASFGGSGAPALPVAEKLAREVLSIPVYPTLTDDERATIADTLAAAVKGAE
ncbi:MAG: DegT/DnrJ/EryC1/StrS family aminotransferase [Actinomycetota bacterium]|nr:DegT/DnrJ/EryC1/StrS family aminotransferase [Actinomycetota bacterium]